MEIVDTDSDTRRITSDLSFMDNIITDCKGMRWEDIMGQVHDQWQILILAAVNLNVLLLTVHLITY